MKITQRTLLRLLWGGALGVMLVCFLAWVGIGIISSQGMIGYHSSWRNLEAYPGQFQLPTTRLEFLSLDGLRLSAWWFPAQGEARATVVLAHGSQGNRSALLPKAAILVRNGVNVLSLDLRAHGDSDGWFMTAGYLEGKDLLGAVRYLSSRSDRQPIFLLGYSYGAVAALAAASETRDIAGVIADSIYPRSDEMMKRADRYLRKDRTAPPEHKLIARLGACQLCMLAGRVVFRLRTGVALSPEEGEPINIVRHLHGTPLLIIGGETDQVAPPEGLKQLYAAADSRNKFLAILSGGNHHDAFYDSPEQYERTVVNFLEQFGASKQPLAK